MTNTTSRTYFGQTGFLTSTQRPRLIGIAPYDGSTQGRRAELREKPLTRVRVCVCGMLPRTRLA